MPLIKTATKKQARIQQVLNPYPSNPVDSVTQTLRSIIKDRDDIIAKLLYGDFALPSFEDYRQTALISSGNATTNPGIFGYFVTVDAYKDNNHAFQYGSNEFLNYSTLIEPRYMTSKVVGFKASMRKIIEDLNIKKHAHLLHIHKLKYRSEGKLPPPDIIQYLAGISEVTVVFDCGTGPGAIFGTIEYHKNLCNSKILCSVANLIDQGPNGGNCAHTLSNINIPGYFFDNFGYKNIKSFTSTSPTKFTATVTQSGTDITINQDNNNYFEGNKINEAYFTTPGSNKLECDRRTLFKKLGDDLQVFIGAIFSKTSRIPVFVSTCDLGVMFLSLTCGLSCIIKDKDEVQSSEQKLGNSWYVKSLLGELTIDWNNELLIAKNAILAEYDDFISVINDVIARITDQTIHLTVSSEQTYRYNHLTPHGIDFFNVINEDLTVIKGWIDAYKPESINSVIITKLKTLMPNKFVLRHKSDAHRFTITLAALYYKGKIDEIKFTPKVFNFNLSTNMTPRTIGKTASKPFVSYLLPILRHNQAHNAAGGTPHKQTQTKQTQRKQTKHSKTRQLTRRGVGKKGTLAYHTHQKNSLRRENSMYQIDKTIKQPYEEPTFLSNFFIYELPQNINRPNSVDIKINDENGNEIDPQKEFFNYIVTKFKEKYSVHRHNMLRANVSNMNLMVHLGITIDDIKYFCLSYVDDRMHSLPDCRLLDSYIDEFIVDLGKLDLSVPIPQSASLIIHTQHSHKYTHPQHSHKYTKKSTHSRIFPQNPTHSRILPQGIKVGGNQTRKNRLNRHSSCKKYCIHSNKKTVCRYNIHK